MKLQNKTAFITDADSGSGKALIRRFSDEGARLALGSASGGAAIDAELEHCREAGLPALVLNCGLCGSVDAGRLLETVAQQVGPIDVLIHNHNAVQPVTVEGCDSASFDEQMAFNVKSAFVWTQAAGRQMAAYGSGGRVIYVSSVHAQKPTGSAFVYSVAKGSLKMLAREAALELGRHGVTVNVIEMGAIEGDDERFKSGISGLYDYFPHKIPSAAPGSFEDAAELAVFLASGSSRFINGSEIRMDGGLLLHYMDHKMHRIAAGRTEVSD